jgi:hypothetical protein
MRTVLGKLGAILPILGILSGCWDRPGAAGAKVFLALGICLAAVFLIFYLVIKGREKD